MKLNLLMILLNILFLSNIKCIEEPTDSLVRLQEPICVLNYDEAEFKEFSKKEECYFQLFMDKLQEIECNIAHEIDKNYPCKTDKCLAKIRVISDEIYEEKYENNLQCVCNCPKSLNDDENCKKESDEKIEKIKTFAEYVDCWNKYWKFMLAKINEKLIGIKPEQCKELGEKHLSRCKKYT